MQHHDFTVLPNGNILMLVVEKKTYDEAIAAGFDPSKLNGKLKPVIHGARLGSRNKPTCLPVEL